MDKAIIPVPTLKMHSITFDWAIPWPLQQEITEATGENPSGHIVTTYAASAFGELTAIDEEGLRLLQATWPESFSPAC